MDRAGSLSAGGNFWGVRVAHFTDCYRPIINGVVTSVACLKEALEKRGHEVFLFAPGSPGHRESEPNVHRFGSITAPFQPEDRFSFPWPPSVMRRLWREKVDVVHIHTPFNVGLMGMRKARWQKIPVVFTHHTLWEEYTHYLRVNPRLGRWLADGVVHYFFRRAQALVAPSEEVMLRVRQQGWNMPIHVIPTGIDAQMFHGGVGDPVRQELSLEDDTRLFLFIGRVAKEKSIDAVLRAFARAEPRRHKFVLALIGGGPELENLRQLAASLELGDSVRFLGYRPRTQLRHYLAAARAFLFASMTETQGLVLLEAAAAGCPVIAVRASGVNEAVSPERTALLVDPDDEAGFTAAILRLGTDDELAVQMAAASVPWAEGFSSETMARRMESVYLNPIQ